MTDQGIDPANMATASLLTVPREIRKAIFVNLVELPAVIHLTPSGLPSAESSKAVQRNGFQRRLREAFPTQYLLVSRMFNNEIKAAWAGIPVIVEEKTVHSAIARPLRHPIMHDCFNITLEGKVSPTDNFVSAAQLLSQLTSGLVLRVLKLRVTSAAYSDARLVENLKPLRHPLQECLLSGMTSRSEIDPNTGIFKFWSSKAGQTMLALLSHSNLEHSMLEVASDGHWAVYCPYHQHQSVACEVHSTHWAGDSMMYVPGDTTIAFINVPIRGANGLLARLGFIEG